MQIDCGAFFADKHRKILGTKWWNVREQLREENYLRALQTGIPFSAVIPKNVQCRILKIVIYDEKSGRIGSKYVELQNKKK